MVKRLLLSTLLFTSASHILASGPRTSAHAIIKPELEYSAETNTIFAWITTGDTITSVTKDLRTGSFHETASIIDIHDTIILVPDKNTVAGLKAEINKYELENAQKLSSGK